MKEIKVIIAGPRGRMGHEAVLLMERTEHFNLVAAVDYKHGGGKISDLPACQHYMHRFTLIYILV